MSETTTVRGWYEWWMLDFGAVCATLVSLSAFFLYLIGIRHWIVSAIWFIVCGAWACSWWLFFVVMIVTDAFERKP